MKDGKNAGENVRVIKNEMKMRSREFLEERERKKKSDSLLFRSASSQKKKKKTSHLGSPAP